MAEEIRGRFSKGKIEPLQKPTLKKGMKSLSLLGRKSQPPALLTERQEAGKELSILKRSSRTCLPVAGDSRPKKPYEVPG